MKPVEGYETLANILTDAFEQASAGKGKERQANGLPFEEQPIITIGRQTWRIPATLNRGLK